MHALSIGTNLGTVMDVTTTTARLAIPVNSSGERPKYIGVIPLTTGVWFDIGGSAVDAVLGAAGTGKSFLLPIDQVTVFRTDGATHFAGIKSGAGDILTCVYPLENEGGVAAAAGSP